MHAHRIKVLDRADDDDVVLKVAHHLKFVLFPAEDGFLDQCFVHGRQVEAAGEDFHQLFAVKGDAAAGAAERERWADDHGEADFAGELEAVFEVVDESGFWDVEADLLHRVLEEKTVFGLLDGRNIGADELGVVFLEDAAVGKLDGEVERGLSADRWENGEACAGREFALGANDFFQVFAGERLDVSAVGDLGIGHDSGRVRIGQHNFVALRLERLAGLGAGVVELGRLADDDGAGAEDQDFRDVGSSRHESVVGRSLVVSRWLGWHGLQWSGSIYGFVIPSEARDLHFQRSDRRSPIFRQILPGWIHRLDQNHLLRPRPSLYLLLSRNRIPDTFE